MKLTPSKTLTNFGAALALIGGIILIIIGIAAAIGIFVLIFYPFYALGSFFYGIALLILGIVCAGTSKYVNHVGAALWLIILAIIAAIFGASFAAWLIVIVAILGLLSRI